MTSDSQVPGFYRLSVGERLLRLVQNGLLDGDDAARLERGEFVLAPDLADKMIENVVGVFGLPLAIAPNFLIDGRDHLVPLVVEEASIVAGLSGAAKLFRAGGGIHVTQTGSLLAGQLQLVDIEDPDAVIDKLEGRHDELIRLANIVHPKLLARGGGVRDIEYRKLRLANGQWTVVLHVLTDTCDAMGANLVNAICEGLAPRVETLTGARAAMKILSNLADSSLVTAQVRVPLEALGEKDFAADFVRDAIVQATAFAEVDPYRAATHNKGIMNGIDAVALATGNDWRAIEAGAHAYAARDGAYRSLSRWQVDDRGGLIGALTVPLKVGTRGGSLHTNPAVGLALRILAVESASDLASVMAAVGLAQNFAALRALVTHGIQKGHMNLHARSVAAAAGATPEIYEQVVRGLVESGDVKSWKAEQLVEKYRGQASPDKGPAMIGPVGVAAGKVILLGEHAAVYDRHALAVPLPDAVAASIAEEGNATRIRIPAWHIDQQVDVRSPAPGAAAIVARVMRELDLSGRNFLLQVDARIPAAMGLGGSAALAVAVIRAFDHLLGLSLGRRATDALAFECEKLAHGTPSGIDNNLATYAEPVLFTRSTATRTKPITLAETPPLVIATSSQRGSTREMVAAVRARYERNTALYETIFDEIGELSVAGAVALRNRDYASLGAMMNVCQGFLNAIEVSTPELERMIHIARAHGAAGAKLTGSGGGGAIVALCPDGTEAVANALRKAGYAIIRTHRD